MANKTRAALLVIILLIGGTAAVFYFLNRPQAPVPVTPTDTPSGFNGEAWISEIHMNSSLTVNDEYFELYVSASFGATTVEGWLITTFDDEGLVALPTLTGVDEEDYIAIFSGTGMNDTDLSDGSGEIHLALGDRILDPNGDEIGVFDGDGEVIDFVRYAGGNGDDLFDGWSESDEGPSLPAGHTGSISFFGVVYEDSSNWLNSSLTPGMPNIHTFLSSTGYIVEIQSGLSEDYTDEGIIDDVGKNETIDISAGPGVSAATIKKIKEHIEFSLEFYEEKGLTRGPATAAGNKIKINVKNGTSTESVGSASPSGVINIEIGTVESETDLKYVGEHELMHLFQFKTEKEGNDTVDHAPVTNKWWIEGQATYWGIESTKSNFNLTNAEIQDEFDRVGDHNWNDHYTDLNRSIFIGWGGSYSDYMGSYLFMKFIREKYGEDKLKEAFDNAKDNFNNNSKDKSPEDAIADACGKTWAQLVAEFAAWMMTDAILDNGVPERVGHVNVTYTNNTVSDSIRVGPYASGVERIKVNGTQPFQIDIKTPPGSQWKITIIYVYEDGSRSQAFNTPYTISGTSAPFPVQPSSHGKKLVEIIVIKTLVQTGSAVQVNMTVSPIDHVTPLGPKQLIPDTWWDWSLPPSFGNYIDPANGNWSQWFWFDYINDTVVPVIEVNVTSFEVDSFFDVIVRQSRVPYQAWYNISNDAPLTIPLPDAPLGPYQIEIRQSTWNSVGRGTIGLLNYSLPGASPESPILLPSESHDCLDLPLPFTLNGTGGIYINFTVTLGWAYWFYFNTSQPWMETASRIWNGTGWTYFQYIPGNDWYQAFVWSATTDTVMIEILTEAPDSFLFCIWSNVT